jgi:hypothetical protein
VRRTIYLSAPFLVLTVASELLGAQSRGELPARMQPAARATIVRLADSLVTERLPTAPLFDKAAEGALKGADDKRIVAAVRGLAQRLREARTLLGQVATDAELSACASALYAGVDAGRIRAVVDARNEHASGRPLEVSLVVLANLVADGVPSSLAAESVTALLAGGVRDADLGAFRRNVARDIEHGSSPVDAASALTKRALQAVELRPRQP